MSGIAGIFHLDGAPVDRAWLQTMADFMAFRGPDGSQMWASGNVGLCHTLLVTSPEPALDSQPCRLDGEVWISADARIDDRETLIAGLRGQALGDPKDATNAQLILHAYRAWGEKCVEHLLGDFAFVLWDSRNRRLFCARDHLGVKPLYYARIENCLLVSNTLDCIRQIPIVSAKLNDQAVGDFLLSGMNQEAGTSLFADIQRVPAAHTLIATKEGLELRRYWTLPIDEPLYYKRSHDYVNRFHELFRKAVVDRLPGGPFGILMSGGLDSPAMAAMAVKLGASPTALTAVYDRVIPDEERFYAGMVAERLRIPIRFRVRDDEAFGWSASSPPIHIPEPVTNPLVKAAESEYWRETAQGVRVLFYGEGPDNALWYEWKSQLSYLVRERRWGRLLRDLAMHAVTQRRLPLLPTLPQIWREWRAAEARPSLPAWLDEGFSSRLHLRERWDEISCEKCPVHPVRPASHRSFSSLIWPSGNEGLDSSYTGTTLEFRHPFLDLRLLRFLLAVPSIPWCRNKYLLRAALRGWIPEPVRRRPKTPVPGFPVIERARTSGLPELPAHVRLGHYVNLERLSQMYRTKVSVNPMEFASNLLPIALNYWLHGI